MVGVAWSAGILARPGVGPGPRLGSGPRAVVLPSPAAAGEGPRTRITMVGVVWSAGILSRRGGGACGRWKGVPSLPTRAPEGARFLAAILAACPHLVRVPTARFLPPDAPPSRATRGASPYARPSLLTCATSTRPSANPRPGPSFEPPPGITTSHQMTTPSLQQSRTAAVRATGCEKTSSFRSLAPTPVGSIPSVDVPSSSRSSPATAFGSAPRPSPASPCPPGSSKRSLRAPVP